MRSLSSFSPPDDGTSDGVMPEAAEPSGTPRGSVGRLLRFTDWIVRVMPRPLRNLLRRPVTTPGQQLASSTAVVVRLTLLLSVVSFVLLAITHLVDVLALGDRILLFDAEEDGGVWTWASVAAQGGGATLLAVLAAASVRWRTYAWCSVGLAYLSLDDAVRIHEKLGYALSFFPHATRLMWPLLYLPLMGVLAVQLWRIADAQEGTAVRALVRGGLLALGVAIFLEAETPLLFALNLGETLVYEIEVVLEEGLEMLGWIWIGGGIAITLLQHFERGPAAQAAEDV